MTKPLVAIIDYEMSNLFSVKRACENVGLNAVITFDKAVILQSEGVILPGVGAFGEAMKNLRRLDLTGPLQEFVASGKPLMGVCLGMQLLMTESEEFGPHAGLAMIPGSVLKFPERNGANKRIKVPQVGWNRVNRPPMVSTDFWDQSPLREINNGQFMYFVHSFYVVPENTNALLSLTTYEGTEFCSAISYKNIAAFQFHPEKSGPEGLKLYRNWALINGFIREM